MSSPAIMGTCCAEAVPSDIIAAASPSRDETTELMAIAK